MVHLHLGDGRALNRRRGREAEARQALDEGLGEAQATKGGGVRVHRASRSCGSGVAQAGRGDGTPSPPRGPSEELAKGRGADHQRGQKMKQ